MIGSGRFSSGMTVPIPATFRDGNKAPVEMENVVVNIQFFDRDHRKVRHMLPPTDMPMVSTGQYLFEYKIPPHAQPGNYVVNIKAKHPGSISNVYEASDTFEIIESKPMDANATAPLDIQASIPTSQPVAPDSPDPRRDFDINTFRIDQARQQAKATKVDVEDIVVDVYNLPLKGVHVNVFEKSGFIPKSPNNMKVASSITDEQGVWRMKLPPGDYVFTYKGIALKENREFRKV